MKRVLLFSMALWLTMIGMAQTQEVTIGTNGGSSNVLPLQTGSSRSFVQQIYYPNEIGNHGMIHSLSFLRTNAPENYWFNNNQLTEVSCYVQVFLTYTDKQGFDGSNVDHEPITLEDVVFDGVLVLPEISVGGSAWITIDFDAPFYYDGQRNLLLSVFYSEIQNERTNAFFATYGKNNGCLNSLFYYGYGTIDPLNPDWSPSSNDGTIHPYSTGATNFIKMMITVADGSLVELLPDSIGFGDTPNNAWKHPQDIVVKNSGLSGVLDAVEVTGNYFSLEGPTTPLDMPFGAQFDYSLSHGNAEGFVNETLNVVYSDEGREVLAVPVTAFAYDPICPDVFELAQVVNTYPYSDTPEQIHNVYQLPGENEDGPDAVYKMSFTDDVVLDAYVENGINPKIALYKEDFGGEGGPHIDNAYHGPALTELSDSVSEWLFYDDGINQTSVGNGGAPVSWGVMFPSSQLDGFQGCSFNQIRIYSAFAGAMTMNVYMGGEDAPGQLVYSQDFQASGNGWFSLSLNTPVLLDVTKNLWICFHSEDIRYPAAACNYCGDPNSCWYSTDEINWAPIYDFNSDLYYSWMIKALVTNEVGGRELLNEGEITDMTVEAGTYYLVASSSDVGFTVNVNAETIPLPLEPNDPTPANGSISIIDPLRLQWNFGQYTTGYRLLFGTTNPPTDVVVDWTNEPNNEYLTGLLSNNTEYFWRVDERNSSGIAEGPVWSFTTTLDKPQQLVADKTESYVGDTVTLTWGEPVNRIFHSYNVYQNGVLIGNTTAQEYPMANLAYNMSGYQFTVAAVYDEGVSDMSNMVLVKVSGEGMVSGSVVEQDRVTPISGVNVKMSGYDEHGLPKMYEFVTDESGHYEGDILAGTYTAVASKEGYQIKLLGSPVVILYQSATNNINFVMDEVYAPVGEVTAVDQEDRALVSWTNELPQLEPQWIYYDNGFNSGSLGNAGAIYWGVNFIDMQDYAGMKLTKIAYYDRFEGGNITVNVYLGGTSSPMELVSSQGFVTTGAGKFVEIELAAPVAIDGTDPLWITCFCDNLLWPASGSPNTGDPHGRWVSFDGINWVDVLAVNPEYNYTWMLRGYLEDANGSPRSLQYYNVYRSNCYDELTAELVATNITDTLYMDTSWNDFEPGVYKWGVSKIYQGNRASRDMVTLLSEGFENGTLPEGWSQYGGDWDWAFTNAFAENINIGPHEGNFAAYCNSDGESGLRNLVTPAIDLSSASTASLTFHYVLPDWDGDWDDLYVKYSTSPTGPWTTLWSAPSETWSWTEITLDLTELCGGVCYLDFSENDWWGYGAAIDDVTIEADVMQSGFEFQTIVDEGFEVGTMPEGWSQYGGDWDWAFTNGFAENINIGPHEGNYAAYCNSDGESGLRNLVTPALDLSSAVAASLTFHYVLPDWDGDWDDLYVKYSTSPTGPWTTLWSAPSETWSWTEITLDLTELCGGVCYLDFSENDWWGYGAAIDNVTVVAKMPLTDQPHESAIVWSNCLDKDMITSVELTVITNNTESPEGTTVSFISISEPEMGHDIDMTLDETGHYVWNDFRKGTYRYSIKKHSFESCADLDTIVINEPTTLECLLEEILHPVENLYVSPTGWATWSGGYLTHGDEFYFDFENGSMDDWTLIDADGDGFDWKLGMWGGSPSIAGHQSSYCVYSESYDPDLGGLYPDNYLVSPRVSISEHSVLSFYACAQDEWYNDHYGVAISTRGNSSPDDFVTIWEETVPSNPSKDSTTDSRGSRNQGGWYYREIDLSAYAGQQVYIAFRHFNTYDMFCIDVDDIRLSDNSRTARIPTGYKVMLDNVWASDVVPTYYQHDVNALVPGQTYNTKVAPVYATGMGSWVNYQWTYVPCDEFAGADQLTVETTTDTVLLNWNLPEMARHENLREGQWYYYDDGVCIDAIGTETGLSIYWAVMFPSGSYEGNQLTKVSMFDRAATGHEGRIMIYQSGDAMPKHLLYTQPYKTFGVDDFVEFELDEPVVIDDAQNLWIVMNNTTGTYVASACAPSSDPNSGWVSLDGISWGDVTLYGLYYSWMLRAYLVTENTDGILGTMVWRDGELLTDTPIQGNTFTDTGLAEGDHEYCIRVVHDGMPDSTYYAMSCALCDEVIVTPTTLNEDEQQLVQVYPNPTRDGIIVKATDMRRLRIVNSLGQLLDDKLVNGDEYQVEMGRYGSGVYVIQVITTHGVSERRVIVTD